MKIIKLVIIAAMAMGLVRTATADYVTNYTFTANQTVPDADANGLALNGVVSGQLSPLLHVDVTLNITNGFNGDLYAYLLGPSGGFAVLFNRVGVSNGPSAFGYGNAGFNITISDNAANDIHYYQNVAFSVNGGGQLTGPWQTDGREIDPMTNAPSAFLDASQTALLSSMNGLNPNGTWTLFLADLSSGGTSKVLDWGLTLTVPEPTSISLVACGLGILALRRSIKARRNK